MQKGLLFIDKEFAEGCYSLYNFRKKTFLCKSKDDEWFLAKFAQVVLTKQIVIFVKQTLNPRKTVFEQLYNKNTISRLFIYGDFWNWQLFCGFSFSHILTFDKKRSSIPHVQPHWSNFRKLGKCAQWPGQFRKIIHSNKVEG